MLNRAGLAQSKATKAALFPISENTRKRMAFIAGAEGRLRKISALIPVGGNNFKLKNSVVLRMGAEKKQIKLIHD